MRLLLTSVACPKGEIAVNHARHLELLAEGADAGCDVVLLPEMSLTGYRPTAALALDHHAVTELVRATVDGPALCFGLVERSASGKPPYITQLVAVGGDLVAVHRKAHLGQGEQSDFRSGPPGGGIFDIAGVTCSMAVCAEIGTAPPYALGSRLVLGPSAPGLYGDRRRTDDDWRRGFDWWRGSVVDDARRLLAGDQYLAVSTQAGATDDEDFPGWAALLGPGGEIVSELPDWTVGAIDVDLVGLPG
ncbi:MAG: nitrilase-related carbon-nitrogen hydrolase [Nocardioidaceae bacterium]